ncbi:hypothetical protein [Spiroplasma cantharicola]|uniref:Uncharacterized protein n=1 Tax=Spiroplasma cantharicola TaxID=362837 RepID=A0A0M4K1Y4_9MOLU|nr:hypothetical protein [Spiroplasma cantharicola]ALD66687.1 hypothetical protein SCANT_v1c07810 [Spiroplasma cantharicola]
MLKNINEISKKIIPLSALNSLNENGYNFFINEVDERTFYEIVEKSDPITSINLLRSFYLYYKIYLNKYLIKPLKLSNSEYLDEVITREINLKQKLDRIIKSLERKIIH